MAPKFSIGPKEGANKYEHFTVRFGKHTLKAQELTGAAGTEISLPSGFLVQESYQHLNLKNQGNIDAESWLIPVIMNIHPRTHEIIGDVLSSLFGDPFPTYFTFSVQQLFMKIYHTRNALY